jgi:RNA polymerase sigma factor (sigma-70 family)
LSRHQTDIELAERAARGDAAATEELVTRALPLVRGLARRLTGDAEEGDALAQEALVAALERIARYRGDAAFSTWVCGIASKRYADAERRKAREAARAHGRGGAGAADPAQLVTEMDSADRLWRLVAQLPPRDRDAIIARAASDSPAEAAEAVGISANAFRVRLHRARLALRELMAARCPELMEELGYGKL